MFAALALFTRLLEPAEYGRYALVVSSAALVTSIAGQWLYSSAMRLAPAAANERRFLSTIFIVYAGVLAVVGLGSLVALPLLRTGELRVLLVLGALLLAATGIVDLSLSILAARMQSGRYAAVSVVRALGSALIGVGLAYLGWGAPGALAGAIVGGILAGAGLLWGDWRQVSVRGLDRGLLREVLAYGLPLSVGFVFYAVIANSDRLLLAGLTDAHTVGLYTAAFDMADKIILSLMMSIANATYPRAVEQLERAGLAAAIGQSRENFTILLGVGLPASIGLAMVGGHFAQVVMGAEFRVAAGEVIPVVAIASFVNNLRSHYFDHAFQLGRRTGGLVAVTAIGAVLAVVLCLWWIPAHGARGAAYAILVAYAASLLACILLGRRSFPLPVPAYETAAIVGASAAMAAVVCLIPNQGDALSLAARIAGGAIVYGAAVLLLLPALRRRLVRRWRRPAASLGLGRS
jgi:O-antigen/teichoic acid export membrane protein